MEKKKSSKINYESLFNVNTALLEKRTQIPEKPPQPEPVQGPPRLGPSWRPKVNMSMN
jgi:hypothetical protein